MWGSTRGRNGWLGPVTTVTLLSLFAVGATWTSVAAADAQEYLVGVGIGDVTGPSVDVGMMGYASASQIARGIHTRLFARCFIFDSKEANGRVVFCSSDLAMMGQAVKLEVVRELQNKFGSLYTSKNVLLSATHTHSGPAGYMEYALYGISSYGFLVSNFRAVVDGIVESIEKAHNSLQPGFVYITSGDVQDANINRSPSSYLANPDKEKRKYNSDVDKKMVLLRIESAAGEPLGSVNWFAVHPTSMNNTNRLISGDNKGYASMHFEYKMNPKDRPGKGKFVAAFASSNLGDVSPNTKGPICIDSGEKCDFEYSTCNGYTQNCIAFGPGDNMKSSTEIIGDRQFKRAVELFEQTEDVTNVHGKVQFSHQYINMSDYKVDYEIGGVRVQGNTCPGALGYSFAAGTTDGPGAFDFTQGSTSDNPFWNLIRDVLHAPTRAQVDCHAPKPILLDVGETHFPYDWVPTIVETQMLRIGNLYIVGMPGELTTMAGRRVREAIEKMGNDASATKDTVAVIAGLSNVYTHYVTTFEEYQKQRYEAASTLYGPHTLSAYIQQFSQLTDAMLSNKSIEDGPSPPLLLKGQISLNPIIVVDMPPFMKNFGECVNEPYPLAYVGETIQATFISGHPRNNPLRSGTFFLVEKKPEDASGSGRWETVATDADWSTTFRWSRPVPLLPNSQLHFTWQIPADAEPGTYRIRHFGYYKRFLNSPLPYDGTTQEFKVTNRNYPALFQHRRQPQPAPAMKIRTVSDFWNALIGNKKIF